jgi:hypothetical protein
MGTRATRGPGKCLRLHRGRPIHARQTPRRILRLR